MDIDLAWAIVAFFVGAIINRWNESWRHTKDLLAAREQAFEAMQRETWVRLQDALGDFWDASTDMGPANERSRRSFERFLERTTGGPGDEVPDPDPQFDAVASKYFMAHQRVTALTARLADDTVRAMAESAIHNISEYQARYGDKGKAFGIDRWTRANEANETVIKKLGELIRQPPAAPIPPPRWRPPWRRSRE